MQLITGSVDTRVRIYDLLDPAAKGRPKHVLEGHVSVVRGLDVSNDDQGIGRWLVTAGRDRVVLVWDLSEKKPKVVQTLLTSESLETVGLIPRLDGVDGLACFTGGEKGQVRLWDVLRGKQVAVVPGLEVEEGDEDEHGLAYVL